MNKFSIWMKKSPKTGHGPSCVVVLWDDSKILLMKGTSSQCLWCLAFICIDLDMIRAFDSDFSYQSICTCTGRVLLRTRFLSVSVSSTGERATATAPPSVCAYTPVITASFTFSFMVVNSASVSSVGVTVSLMNLLSSTVSSVVDTVSVTLSSLTASVMHLE